MKPILRLAVLVFALMLAAAPALAACPNTGDYSYNFTFNGNCYKVTCTDGKCVTSPCKGDSTCTNNSCPNEAKPVATKKPAATKAPSTCPSVTAKPVATKKPEATKAPSATKKPSPTKKPSATKAPEATKAPSTGTSLSAMASDVVSQTNAERAKQGLGSLKVSSELTRAACVRAQEIVQKFSHTRPDGSAWSSVSSSARGENIAMGQQSADKVMAAWMSSSGHRANILRSSFGSIGVCAYKVGNTMYWVQLFGG